MRICYLADARAMHIKRWAEYFTNKGHEVHLISLNPETLSDFGEVKLHIVKKMKPSSTLMSRFLNLLPVLMRIRTLIKNISPDILHSHSVIPYGWLGMLTGFHPFIITPWGSDILIDIQNSKIDKIFTSLALRKSELITCDGENIKEAMANLGISSKKIRFIIFGVDIQKFKPTLENGNFREKLCSPNSKIIISTRFLTPVHNVETLIKAIPIVLEKIQDIKFVIIGSGPEKEFLVNLAKTLGVFNTTKFVGEISEDEMIRYLNSADVYVSTSLSESGLAASTAEAMACGLSIINTDTGDIDLWIKDGEGGFIIPTKNPQKLAEKIIYLLKNDEERIRFGKINRKVIEKRNNYYKEMAKMESIYKELIEVKL